MREAANDKNNLQFFWDTAVHDKSLLLLFRPKEGTRRCVTGFGQLSGATILSLAFRGSAEIINSETNGLIVHHVDNNKTE